MAKQISHAFKPRTRKSETVMLILAGLNFTSSGLVSIAQIRDKLLGGYPEALNKFPQYADYFSMSTYVALSASLFFLMFPMGISAWLGRYLIGISLGYLILGTYGITTGFPIIFYVLYWMAIVLPVLSRINTINFYRKTTKIDFPIFLILSVALLILGLMEFLKIINI